MSEPQKVSDPNILFTRYELLKKQYFSSAANPQYDEEGEELPNAISRSYIIAQFEQMGCQLPLSPTQEFTPMVKRNG